MNSRPTTRRGGLALFGGAFDPPHLTHRRIVEAALAQLPVDELRVLPAGDHPWKRGDAITPAEHRVRMCQLAFANVPRTVVDEREVARAGPSFTVDTLAELKAEQPGRVLFFLLGSDNLPAIAKWRDHHRILSLATVVTFPRAGSPIEAIVLDGLDLTKAERTSLLSHTLEGPADAVAATDLRERLRAGERGLAELDPEVEAYALAHRLYGT